MVTVGCGSGDYASAVGKAETKKDMTNAERDRVYEVVWAGGEGLTADRETKNIGVWSPPPRLYNKTGNHSKKTKTTTTEVSIIDPLEED